MQFRGNSVVQPNLNYRRHFDIHSDDPSPPSHLPTGVAAAASAAAVLDPPIVQVLDFSRPSTGGSAGSFNTIVSADVSDVVREELAQPQRGVRYASRDPV